MTLTDLFQTAKNHLKDLTPLSQPDFRLEQAEYNKDEKIWDVVVSYLVENTNKRINPLNPLSSDFQYHRIYKKLKINDNTSEILGFYIFNKE